MAYEGKKLRKSKTEKKICGGCGGIAEYFNIDTTIVRWAGVLRFFAYGAAVLACLAAARIMPEALDR